MKLSGEWLATSGADFGLGSGDWGLAQLNQYTAAYREWGAGTPLVLIPGLAGGADLMEPLARRLSNRFRVLCYQLRGEDDPFLLRRRFGLSDLLHDLADFIDWHCLERPAVLGVSFGGLLALEFAARYPRRLGRIAVQGVGAWFETGWVQRLAGEVLNRYPLPPDNPFINQFFNLLFGSNPKGSDLSRFVTRQCWQTDQSIIAHRFHMVQQFDLRDRLQDIADPVLALAGERDVLVSGRSLNALADGAAQARVKRLPGAGHFACVTHPTQLAEEVSRFLAE